MAGDYLNIQIAAALKRLATDYPDLDFGVESSVVDAAETRLNAAWDAWPKGGPLNDVWRALKDYREALLTANGRRLFE